jgi:hypothetical protein
MSFPNMAGVLKTDDVLAAELKAAGINVDNHEFLRHRNNYEFLRRGMDQCRQHLNAEVKSAIMGSLYGWTFERSWNYWVCKGPGIEVKAAERLHNAIGQEVRIDGHCGCPSPRDWFHGLACGHYHVDTPAGLKALADTIKELVEKPKCGMRCERQPDDMISGHIEYEPMTLCGKSTCSEECWKSWAFCPYCGKPFVISN